jgi:hypothetical protein
MLCEGAWADDIEMHWIHCSVDVGCALNLGDQECYNILEHQLSTTELSQATAL